MKTLLTKGDWGHSRFEAYLDVGGNFESLRQMVTSVVSVCFSPDGNVILSQRKDGSLDLLGGHIEPGESIEETLRREALEEGGVELTEWKYFGYYLITQSRDAPREYKEKYPEKSYILFFISKGKRLWIPKDKKISDTKSFSIEELQKLKTIKHVMLQEAIKLHTKAHFYS